MADEAFADWRPAPNIRDAPELYELENEALDPQGRVLGAMRRAGDWRGRTLVDLGCGTGFWLPGYAGARAGAGAGAGDGAARVLGVEPDPMLRARAVARVGALAGVEVLAGSAEHLPFEDGLVDVVHARFAYFFGPGAEAGLAEVRRVLSPGGVFVAVDNDHGVGEFASILRVAGEGLGLARRDDVEAWWAARGAERVTVLSEWRFATRADLCAVLANEFRDGAAESWLAAHPRRVHITYGFALFVVRAGG